MKRFAIILLHVAYWITYLLLLLLLLTVSWLQSRHLLHQSFHGMAVSWVGWIDMLIIPLLSYYVFYGVLFSRFLKRKRLLLLFVSGVGACVGLTLFGLLLTSVVYAPRMRLHFGQDMGLELLILSIVNSIHGVLALVMKGFISWYADIHLKEALNRKNYEMELALIKSQLSPHFLFNTLNNIDVLIQRDPERASGYLNQLSDMLRFMLYETKAERIPISQELQYIEKYIQLQKIRTAHPEHIHYVVEGQMGNRQVEPMLFIPFIENAFKHAEKKIENAIVIRFTFGEDRIIFICENKCKRAREPVLSGGLGNSLIRRRLSLLYPGRHHLDIDAGESSYKATLTLTYAN